MLLKGPFPTLSQIKSVIYSRAFSTMELLAECEENLRALSVEARKLTRLSGVKEAAERGILKVGAFTHYRS